MGNLSLYEVGANLIGGDLNETSRMYKRNTGSLMFISHFRTYYKRVVKLILRLYCLPVI